MRLWTISPKYLDSIGLVALWRESLLAKHVLEGKTKGYKNHPQLLRFKNTFDPQVYIAIYLKEIYLEAVARGYDFDETKIPIFKTIELANIPVSLGQVKYEYQLLSKKVMSRKIGVQTTLQKVDVISVFSIFSPIPGEIESWEKIKTVGELV